MFEDIILEVQDEYNVIVGNAAFVTLNYAAVDGLEYLIEEVTEPDEVIESSNDIEDIEQIREVLVDEFNDLPQQLDETSLPDIEDELAREELNEILRELVDLRGISIEDEPRIYANQATVAGIRLLSHQAAEQAEEIVEVQHIDDASIDIFDIPILFSW